MGIDHPPVRVIKRDQVQAGTFRVIADAHALVRDGNVRRGTGHRDRIPVVSGHVLKADIGGLSLLEFHSRYCRRSGLQCATTLPARDAPIRYIHRSIGFSGSSEQIDAVSRCCKPEAAFAVAGFVETGCCLP